MSSALVRLWPRALGSHMISHGDCLSGCMYVCMYVRTYVRMYVYSMDPYSIVQINVTPFWEHFLFVQLPGWVPSSQPGRDPPRRCFCSASKLWHARHLDRTMSVEPRFVLGLGERNYVFLEGNDMRAQIVVATKNLVFRQNARTACCLYCRRTLTTPASCLDCR